MSDRRNPERKLFLEMRGTITGKAALARYPDPQFFMRPDMRQSVDELRHILRRNCDEAERIIPMLRATTSFKIKEPIFNMAQRLHDLSLGGMT